MKKLIIPTLFCALFAGLPSTVAFAQKAPKAPAPAPVGLSLFKPGDTGSKNFRIPSLVCTVKGTLVALADLRPIVGLFLVEVMLF